MLRTNSENIQIVILPMRIQWHIANIPKSIYDEANLQKQMQNAGGRSGAYKYTRILVRPWFIPNNVHIVYSGCIVHTVYIAHKVYKVNIVFTARITYNVYVVKNAYMYIYIYIYT